MSFMHDLKPACDFCGKPAIGWRQMHTPLAEVWLACGECGVSPSE